MTYVRSNVAACETAPAVAVTVIFEVVAELAELSPQPEIPNDAMARSRVRRWTRVNDLRRRQTKRRPPTLNAHVMIEGCATLDTWAGAAESESVVVAPAPPEGVSEAGLNEHEVQLGAPEHVKLTGALKPLTEVTVSRATAGANFVTVTEPGRSSTLKSGVGGGVTTTLTAGEVDAAKFASPL